MVQPDIGAPGLPPRRERELVLVGGKVAEPVELSGRAVGYNALVGATLPGESRRV